MVSKNKSNRWGRAVSPVIATVLIIALVVASSAAVWIIVNQMLDTNANFSVTPETAYDYNKDGLVDTMDLKVSNSNADDYNMSYVSLENWEVYNKDTITAGSSSIITIYTSLTSAQLEVGKDINIGFSPVPVITSLSIITVPAAKSVTSLTVSYVSGGAPISGVYVSFEKIDGSPVSFPPTKTDSNGEMTADLLPGDYIAKASAYQSAEFNNIATKFISITGANSEKVFVKVVDGAGIPISGLTIFDADISQNDLGGSAVTNSSGFAQFSVIGGEYLFYTTYLSQQFWSSQFSVPISGSNIITIQIKSGYVAGRVVYGGENINQTYWVRLYSSTNVYLGTQIRLNTNGEFNFTSGVTSGIYKVRLLANNRWWIYSDIVSSSTENLVVDYGGGYLNVKVELGGESLPNSRTYLFLATGSYMGWKNTNGSGVAAYGLYPGFDLKIRLDYLRQQVYSSNFTHTSALKTIDFGGGKLNALMTTGGEGLPAGALMRLFTGSGSYTGRYAYTNSSGWADFGLAVTGEYTVRVDWLRSYTFTDPFNHTDKSPQYLDIAGGRLDVRVMAGGTALRAGILVRLFTAAGSYTGRYDYLNSSGWAEFGAILGAEYKLRIDWLRNYSFTANFTHVNSTEKVLDIGGGPLEVKVTAGGQTLSNGILIRLFTVSESYTGLYAYTNTSGIANFGVILNGTFKIRVDWLRKYTMSDLFENNGSLITIELGGGNLVMKITSSGQDLPSGVLLRLFTYTNSYTGRYAYTNGSSYVNFGVILGGNYTLRIDWLSLYTFSNVFEHNNTVQTIDYAGGSLVVRMTAGGEDLRSGILLRLFTAAGSYTGRYAYINGSGGFGDFGVILEGSFKIRIDWLSQYKFSANFTHNGSVQLLDDSLGGNFTIALTVGGAAIPENTRVYLYTSTGSYAGLWVYANASGYANFGILLGGDYKIRIYHTGNNYYSDVIAHSGLPNYSFDFPGIGTMTITVTGVIDGTTIYLYHSDARYTGFWVALSGGQAVFSGIPNGDYYIRQNYINSGVFTAASSVTVIY